MRGVGVIVERELAKNKKEILLGRRTRPRPGYEELTWELPGGKLNGSESVYSAARRELYEETGLILNHIDIIHKHEHIEDSTPWETYGVLVQASGTPQTKESIIGEWKWYALNNLPNTWHISQQVIDTYAKKVPHEIGTGHSLPQRLLNNSTFSYSNE